MVKIMIVYSCDTNLIKDEQVKYTVSQYQYNSTTSIDYTFSPIFGFYKIDILKGRSHRLRPKPHIFDELLGNHTDSLKVHFEPPYGP